jgi:hypothetical protein
VELVHVFLLHVFLEGQIKSRDMFFYSVDDCVYFAQRLHKQSASGKITAYCLPVKVDPDKTKVYR